MILVSVYYKTLGYLDLEAVFETTDTPKITARRLVREIRSQRRGVIGLRVKFRTEGGRGRLVKGGTVG
jgi:hypothetical protein